MATTLAAVRQYLGTLSGNFFTGTPAGTFSTTQFTCAAMAGRFQNDKFNDNYIRFYAGTHIDTTVRINNYVGATAGFTFQPALTGSVDATDLFEVWPKGYNPDEVDSVINLALQSVENFSLEPKYDETIVIDDLLTDSRLEVWESSLTELTNWAESGDGALTQGTSILREGTYSAKMEFSSTEHTLSQSIANPMKYAGKSFTFVALCASVTADIARVRVTDGTTAWNSSYHDGSGWLDSASQKYLKVTGTLGDSPTELTASMRVSGAGTVYWDKAYLLAGEHIYEYTVPTGFQYISKIIVEKGVGNFPENSGLVDYARGWKLISDSTTPKIVFDPTYAQLTSGQLLRLIGQAYPSTLTADTSTTDINPAYLAWQAKAFLHAARITDDSNSSKQHSTQLAIAERKSADYYPRSTPKGRKVYW